MAFITLLITRLNRVKWRIGYSITLLILLYKLFGAGWQPPPELAWSLPNYVPEAHFSSDGRLLVTRQTLERGAKLAVWDAHTGQLLKERTFETDFVGLALMPDDSQISVVTDKGLLLQLNPTSLETLAQTQLENVGDAKLQEIAYSPNGQYLCIVGIRVASNTAATGFAWIYAQSMGRPSMTLEWSQYYFPPPLAFSADGSRLAIGTNVSDLEGILRVWDTTSWREILTAEPSDTIASVAWSPDGSEIAVGRSKGEIDVVRASDLGEVRSTKTTGGITSLKYSADGCVILFSGTFSPAQAMDSRSGELAAVLSELKGISVAFSASSIGDLMLISQFSFDSDASKSTSAVWHMPDYLKCGTS